MDWQYQIKSTGERKGPVSEAAIAEAIASGELASDDLAWRIGLSEWTPLDRLPQFSSRFAGAAAIPMAQVTGRAEIGYYTPRIDAPARVQENLKGYARATGPTDDWPLNDDHVEQLAVAVRHRKRILSAFNLARLGLLVTTVALVFGIILIVVILTTSRRTGPYEIGFAAGAFLFYAVFVALFYFGSRGIRLCHIWASLTLAILSTLGTLATLASIALQAADPRLRDATPVIIGGAVTLLIGGIFSAIYWRAWTATPRFLDSPIWCQEALVVAEKAK